MVPRWRQDGGRRIQLSIATPHTDSEVLQYTRWGGGSLQRVVLAAKLANGKEVHEFQFIDELRVPGYSRLACSSNRAPQWPQSLSVRSGRQRPVALLALVGFIATIDVSSRASMGPSGLH